MMANPATWPIGILPIAFFVLGIVQLVNILIRKKQPASDSFVIFMGFVPSLLVVIAWFAGYQRASDHTVWKFILLSVIGGLIWIPLRYHVLARGEFGDEIDAKVTAFTRLQLWRNLVISVASFCLICGIFLFIESQIRNPEDCTRLMCDVGVTLFGSQYGSSPFLWFFTLFTTLAWVAAVVSLLALLKRRH